MVHDELTTDNVLLFQSTGYQPALEVCLNFWWPSPINFTGYIAILAQAQVVDR